MGTGVLRGPAVPGVCAPLTSAREDPSKRVSAPGVRLVDVGCVVEHHLASRDIHKPDLLKQTLHINQVRLAFSKDLAQEVHAFPNRLAQGHRGAHSALQDSRVEGEWPKRVHRALAGAASRADGMQGARSPHDLRHLGTDPGDIGCR